MSQDSQKVKTQELKIVGEGEVVKADAAPAPVETPVEVPAPAPVETPVAEPVETPVVDRPAPAPEEIKPPEITPPAPELTREDASLTEAKKPEFDANSVANILDVDAGKVVKEGGVSTAHAVSMGIGKDGSRISDMARVMMEEEQKGMWELYGFRASFKSGDDVAVSEVRRYFGNKEVAMAQVNGRKYMHCFPDMSTSECTIVEGMPKIAYDDVEKFNYIDGVWVRP